MTQRLQGLRKGDLLLALGGLICIVLVLVNMLAGISAIRTLRGATDWLIHSHEVETQLERIATLAADAETSERGYLITGDESYLATYKQASKGLRQQLQIIRDLTSDNAVQQAHLEALDHRVEAKIEEFESTIRLKREGQSDEAIAVVLSNRARTEMLALRKVIDEMKKVEQQAVADRVAARQQAFAKAVGTSTVGGVTAAVALALVTWATRRYLNQARQAATAIADREERLRTTLASIGDGVIATDPEGRVTSLNAVAEQLTGWSNADAFGVEITEVFHIVNETTRVEVPNPALEALETGRVVALANHTLLISRTGREIPIDDSAAPIRCEDQEIMGSVLVFRDVSQRRAWEGRLRKSEEQFRRAFEDAPIPIVIHTEDGEILQVSRAWNEVTGWTFPEHRHLPPWLLEAYGEIDLSNITESESRPLRAFELHFTGADGKPRTWSYNAACPAALLDGKRFVVGMAEDVTERVQLTATLKRARESAEAASQSRGLFLANMSHEIRTPMTAILGHADILREHLRDPDNLQSVDTIASNGRYLLQIINDILDLSKIDAGRTEIEREPVKPHDLFAEIQSLLSVSAADKELAFAITCEGLIPETIETDPVRLRQILVNLIGNAIKFTDSGHVSVVVRYQQEQNQLTIEVNDTGIGVDPDSIERIFDPFVQADSSTTRTRQGSGLGLAICRRLAEALGGTITVDSRKGQGSSFTLTIDCGNVTDVDLIHATLFVKKPEQLVAPVHTKLDCTVLVVDDRRDIRFLVRRFIEKADGRVIEATNGQEAFDMITGDASIDGSIDIVLMDMQMPVLDGYDATVKLRERGIQLPIIALTANAMVEDRQRCLAAGCDDYCSKPIDGYEMVQKIHRLTTARE
ncbi:CHASE3 domain-containing protein [Aeoliella sp. SH292]|uniref:CHASE3 domain-containing protein n=1 Tax=Aeoliella sp. SH292 TaxID=3454464 RepID=UPI003F9A2EF2